MQHQNHCIQSPKSHQGMTKTRWWFQGATHNPVPQTSPHNLLKDRQLIWLCLADFYTRILLHVVPPECWRNRWSQINYKFTCCKRKRTKREMPINSIRSAEIRKMNIFAYYVCNKVDKQLKDTMSCGNGAWHYPNQTNVWNLGIQRQARKRIQGVGVWYHS